MSESDQCSRFSIPRPLSAGLSEISETSHEPISMVSENTSSKNREPSSSSESTEYEEIEIEVTASESECDDDDQQQQDEKVPTPTNSDKSDSNPTASSKSNSNSMKSVIESTAHAHTNVAEKSEEKAEEHEDNKSTCSSSSEYEEIEIEVTDSEATSSESESDDVSKNNSNNSKHVETSLASISSFRDTTDRNSSSSESSFDDEILETYSICPAKSFPIQRRPSNKTAQQILERSVSQNSLNDTPRQMAHFQRLGSNSSFQNLVGRDMRRSTSHIDRRGNRSYTLGRKLRRSNSLQV